MYFIEISALLVGKRQCMSNTILGKSLITYYSRFINFLLSARLLAGVVMGRRPRVEFKGAIFGILVMVAIGRRHR